MFRKIHGKLCAYMRYIVQRGHTFSGNMLKINAQIAKQWFSLVLVGPGKMQKCAYTKLHHFCKKGICKNVTEISKNMLGICNNMQKYANICKIVSEIRKIEICKNVSEISHAHFCIFPGDRICKNVAEMCKGVQIITQNGPQHKTRIE